MGLGWREEKEEKHTGIKEENENGQGESTQQQGLWKAGEGRKRESNEGVAGHPENASSGGVTNGKGNLRM